MIEKKFQLHSNFKPTGDQPKAIEQLSEGILNDEKYQTLLGVTGSGKTFSMANVIANINKPTLIISHNKTLAAQLYGELKGFFPKNAVEYFISYYDYYQPEAYIPATDTYIAKEATINELIDKLRLRATASLMARTDVIIVASVSCIYNIGSPAEFQRVMINLFKDEEFNRDRLLRELVDIHYSRNDVAPQRGTFRVRGDIVEVFPAYDDNSIRISFWGDKVEKIQVVAPLTGEIIDELQHIAIFPAKHFIVSDEQTHSALDVIESEMIQRVREFEFLGKPLEAQRIRDRTLFDIEMLKELGYCSGIENYSRQLSQRKAGERPWTLIDFFPSDFLTIIDESHVTVPQIGGMYMGDRSRKLVLIENGFRLPSALDNRPLFFSEFESLLNNVVFVSATPANYELEKSQGRVVEQIVRPTGLIDPEVIVKPSENQIEDLIGEIKARIKVGEKVLVTTLTKKMAEDLSEYFSKIGLKCEYLHSEIESVKRIELLRGLRLGEFDVLIGINLLREGLDLPEVSLVAILDADKVGFLRSARSLIQTSGRAARNIAGRVILYADRISDAMKQALAETGRRREIQLKYNKEHNITPVTITKTREEILSTTDIATLKKKDILKKEEYPLPDISSLSVDKQIEILAGMMKEAAGDLKFEFAAKLRDRIKELTETSDNPKKKKKKSPYSKYKRRKNY